MTRSQRLRTCCNLLQLADCAQRPALRRKYLMQLSRTLGRLKKKNDHRGVGAAMIAR